MANEFVARNGLIAQNNSTVTGSLIVTGGITGSLLGTASYANQVLSSSFSSTASFVQNAQTASFVQTAQTASYVLNAVSSSFSTTSSYALTASYALNAGGGGTITVADEGTAQGPATFFDFIGTGVTATVSSNTASITISGGGTTIYGYNATASFTNQTTWTFNHNLGSQFVIIQALDTSYNQIIPSSITLTGINQATLTFPVSQSGYAIASLGGDPISASYALTASYALNGGGGGSGAGFPFTGSAEITGSLTVIGPLTATAIYSPATNLFNYYNFI